VKVAFFGGSFNPPHVGHVLAASYALSIGFDRVLAVVVKDHAFGKPLVAFEHRARMTELAFTPLPDVEVSRVEAQLPTPNYTLLTLRAVIAAHPDWQLRLLVGSDVMREVDRWHSFDEVAKLAPLFLLDRAGHDAAGRSILPEISSTQIRDCLAAPSAEAEAWLSRHVPASVLDYLRTHGLYAKSASA